MLPASRKARPAGWRCPRAWSAGTAAGAAHLGERRVALHLAFDFRGPARARGSSCSASAMRRARRVVAASSGARPAQASAPDRSSALIGGHERHRRDRLLALGSASRYVSQRNSRRASTTGSSPPAVGTPDSDAEHVDQLFGAGGGSAVCMPQIIGVEAGRTSSAPSTVGRCARCGRSRWCPTLQATSGIPAGRLRGCG